MLDVSVFRNLRFSAASISITFVFFALMGVMYFLTTYLQSVLGYSALQAGVKMLPIAIGMILASKLVVGTDAPLRHEVLRGGRPAHRRAARSAMIATFETDTTGLQIALRAGDAGHGHGPRDVAGDRRDHGRAAPAKAGIGSAMNDVVREVGGTLGVAVLGSILSTRATAGHGRRDGRTAHAAAEAASDSVGAAHEVGAQLGGGAGAKLIDTANSAFVDAMTTTAGLAAGVALAGALVAAAFLPSRARSESQELLEAAPA